jgi:hypothetical protein
MPCRITIVAVKIQFIGVNDQLVVVADALKSQIWMKILTLLVQHGHLKEDTGLTCTIRAIGHVGCISHVGQDTICPSDALELTIIIGKTYVNILICSI